MGTINKNKITAANLEYQVTLFHSIFIFKVYQNLLLNSISLPIEYFCYNIYMETKRMVYFGLFVGSSIGSYLPNLWGDSFLSFPSIILSAVGGLVGIYIGYKLSTE